MENEFDRILDLCIDRINRGESPETCLTDYPEHAKQLEPLLLTAQKTVAVFDISPSMDAKRAARQRFSAAMEKQEKPSFVDWLRRRPVVWSTVTAVLVLVIVGFVALRSTMVSPVTPVFTVASASADGNFIFLVSDEENAIGDFDSLLMEVEKIELIQSGKSEQIVEFVPTTTEFDLVLLPGDETQEIWQGTIPIGDYAKIIMYVKDINYEMTDGGSPEVKLPSNKLQLNHTFNVAEDTVTTFTYDITVVKTGNNDGKYIIKPQISESGSSQEPKTASSKSEKISPQSDVPVQKPDTPPGQDKIKDNGNANNANKE